MRASLWRTQTRAFLELGAAGRSCSSWSLPSTGAEERELALVNELTKVTIMEHEEGNRALPGATLLFPVGVEAGLSGPRSTFIGPLP